MLLIIVFLGLIFTLVFLFLQEPKNIASMESISEPFKSVDFVDLPNIDTFKARDGSLLTFRNYEAQGNVKGSIVLVHGSSASSPSMHVLAKQFAMQGFKVFTLDMRGHGESGEKGKIAYIGQLEDDLEDFTQHASIIKPAILGGFSSGGGFVLRFAGSKKQELFDKYVLLSPFISERASNYRPDSGGWVSVAIPRIIILNILNQCGIRFMNDLPVIKFALKEEDTAYLTAQYSYALATNFRPLTDFEANIQAVQRPVIVIAGTKDEVFFTNKLQDIFYEQNKKWLVFLIDGAGHTPLIVEKNFVDAIVKFINTSIT